MSGMVTRISKALRTSDTFSALLGLPIYDTSYEALVREVVRSMSEPTEAMKDCGVDAGWFFDTYGTDDRGREAAATLWRNMIKKALEE